uniref:Phosphoesterase n=1 Tax=Arcella intermedia TaxID=1963864 RepID=A0A6B2L3K1_9EUKA
MPIKHWIVIMMENRSFDHLLGYLKKLNSQIDGLTGDESNLYNPADPNSKRVFVNFNSPDVDPNAGHSVQATTQQIFGSSTENKNFPPPMSGFVASAEGMSAGWGPEVLSCFNSTSLSVLSSLAMEFALFDHWFASVPGPTEINRAYLHSCSSHGLGDNDPTKLAEGIPGKTIFTSIGDAGYDWKIYYELLPAALFMQELREYPENFHTLWDFYDDCEAGTLPTYSFIEPRYYTLDSDLLANDQHPSHEISQGELFLKKMYEAVRASPQWNQTALILTYDEHGGYYDHVPTPLDIPNPDGLNSTDPAFNFTRIGIRIPTVIISPWVPKGTLVNKGSGPTPTSEFEHSSIAATLKKVLNLPKFLTKRDEWASTFESVFSLSEPRTDCPATLPDPYPFNLQKPNQHEQPIHELQHNLLLMAQALTGNKDDISPTITEREAGLFVEKQMKEWQTQAKALQENKVFL